MHQETWSISVNAKNLIITILKIKNHKITQTLTVNTDDMKYPVCVEWGVDDALGWDTANPTVTLHIKATACPQLSLLVAL